MRHPATQALYAYWNEVRGARIAPRRLDIQPARIAGLLLDAFILERTDGRAFRFRLAGTRVAARFGLQLKSESFLSCWGEGDRGLLAHHLASIAELGRVGVFTGEATLREDPDQPGVSDLPYAFELVILPLVHSGETIDRLLCLLVPLDPQDAWPDASIHRLRLVAAQSVRPDGALVDPFVSTDAYASLADRQVPLRPHVRTARIVRQGRRQFRVYEGGQSGKTDGV
ncbi:MAG: PAS domain-containing protein [Rhizobiales bacterium]|nr:PAS domain-containing protein [Hyphomicrobiales bacterium]